MDKYLLENITKITFTIMINYSRLALLEISKDISPDYEKKKKILLAAIALLKIEEEKIYEPLKEDYITAQSYLDYFNKRENDNVKEKFYLCQKRIKNNLKRIVFSNGLDEENEDFIESYLEEEFFTYLFFDREFSKDEMLTFIEILPIINNSLDHNFISNISEDINNPDNFDIRRLLINIKLNWIFETGGLLERDALNHNFDNLEFNPELKIPNISDQLKTDFLNFEIKNKLYDIITIMAAVTDKDLVLGEIEWFKTYLFYLDSKSIEEINKRIKYYNFQNKDIQNTLLQFIEHIKNIQTIHNNQKTL